MTAITSLALPRPARPPRRLAPGHWAIEHGLDDLCDVTFAESGAQLPTGTGPHVLVCRRHLASGQRGGAVNLAGALRRHSRGPARPRTILEMMKPTLRENAGALTETQRAMLGSRGIIRVIERCATPGTGVTTARERASSLPDLRRWTLVPLAGLEPAACCLGDVSA